MRFLVMLRRVFTCLIFLLLIAKSHGFEPPTQFNYNNYFLCYFTSITGPKGPYDLRGGWFDCFDAGSERPEPPFQDDVQHVIGDVSIDIFHEKARSDRLKVIAGKHMYACSAALSPPCEFPIDRDTECKWTVRVLGYTGSDIPSAGDGSCQGQSGSSGGNGGITTGSSTIHAHAIWEAAQCKILDPQNPECLTHSLSKYTGDLNIDTSLYAACAAYPGIDPKCDTLFPSDLSGDFIAVQECMQNPNAEGCDLVIPKSLQGFFKDYENPYKMEDVTTMYEFASANVFSCLNTFKTHPNSRFVSTNCNDYLPSGILAAAAEMKRKEEEEYRNRNRGGK